MEEKTAFQLITIELALIAILVMVGFYAGNTTLWLMFGILGVLLIVLIVFTFMEVPYPEERESD